MCVFSKLASQKTGPFQTIKHGYFPFSVDLYTYVYNFHFETCLSQYFDVTAYQIIFVRKRFVLYQSIFNPYLMLT